MDDKMGFALVGAGTIAEFHAQALERLPDAYLAGVYDVSAQARDFADRHRITCYSRYEELLADERVQVVGICTPSGLRERYAVEGAAAKKHIICEKPVEIALDRIDRMIAACDKNGVTLSGIFNNRYSPVYRRIRQAVDEGEFGRLILGDVYVKWYRDTAYYKSSGWRGTWAYDGGGALMNQSIHFIDLLQWFMGPVKGVKSYTATNLHPIEVEDTAVAALEFESGALGIIEGTTAARPGLCDRMELHGETGSVLVENGAIRCWNLGGNELDAQELAQLNGSVSQTAKDPKAVGFQNHLQQLEETVRCIREGVEPPLSGKEARKAVEIILRIYENAAKTD